AIELALSSAYKKETGLTNVRAEVDRDTCDFKLYSFKTVVLDKDHEKTLDEDDIIIDDNFEALEHDEKMEYLKPFTFNERIHITLEDAKKIVPDIEIGETIEEEVTPKDFGRVAAATAKQVVIQKIREAEKNNIIQEFGDKQDEMLNGTVAMEDEKNYYIDFGKAQGILSKKDIIPNEEIKMGSTIKVYITKVENGTKGPLILLSRNNYGFVKRLFELEIPEITDGTVLIYSVAREAGIRSKVSVYSTNDRVDAVSSCIGEKGMRIANILKELKGEKLDVVYYDKDPAKFIENALAPAKNIHVLITDQKKNEALVIVDKDNYSLAIGRGGLNVKLASRLTKYKLDIKTKEEASEMGINFVEE
ncbi:MAG: transcription termination/antitermination protein NusA, partial [Bacilli bacterium]|nr:transcription termination/antitermination protein NusA [Bacilli bacterium]